MSHERGGEARRARSVEGVQDDRAIGRREGDAEPAHPVRHGRQASGDHGVGQCEAANAVRPRRGAARVEMLDHDAATGRGGVLGDHERTARAVGHDLEARGRTGERSAGRAPRERAVGAQALDAMFATLDDPKKFDAKAFSGAAKTFSDTVK